MNKITREELKELQSLSLEDKIYLSKDRICQWYKHWDEQIYISFSGGKDSTVLLDLVRSLYPKTPAVFFDTGLEWPEIREFVKTIDDVEWIKPKKKFVQVIEEYGYPIISKENSYKIYQIRTTKSEKLLHKRLYGANDKYKAGKLPEKWRFLIDAPFKIHDRCCHYLKKELGYRYEKLTGRKPIIGTLAEDSHYRTQHYIRHGCNAFDVSRPKSVPMSFWKNEDVWDYIKQQNLKISSIYDMGYKNTGCMFCMFGVHLEKEPNRFQRMKKTHPTQWKYCMNKLGLREVLEYIGVPIE